MRATTENTTTENTTTEDTATENTATENTENCINTIFNADNWTVSLFTNLESKNTSTLSARAKGLETQGLIARIIQEDTETVLTTLDNAVALLPDGTEEKTVVIRENVTENEPIPQRCEFKDNCWITTEKKNPRQILKSAVRSAILSLRKRHLNKKDSYSLGW